MSEMLSSCQVIKLKIKGLDGNVTEASYPVIPSHVENAGNILLFAALVVKVDVQTLRFTEINGQRNVMSGYDMSKPLSADVREMTLEMVNLDGTCIIIIIFMYRYRLGASRG